MIAQFPTIKREDAQRFLKVLDEHTDKFTFQTFDDNRRTKDKRLARILHGTLDENYAELVNYSRVGAGIFVTINATNFRGRTKECIVEVRFYFSDLDGAPYENISRLVLKPHITTQTSPGRYGVFYNIADAPLSEENFRRTQQQLAQLFEGDPSICDLPRVMRLPGFPHQKDPATPYITEIHHIDGETPLYTCIETRASSQTKAACKNSICAHPLPTIPNHVPLEASTGMLLLCALKPLKLYRFWAGDHHGKGKSITHDR